MNWMTVGTSVYSLNVLFIILLAVEGEGGRGDCTHVSSGVQYVRYVIV